MPGFTDQADVPFQQEEPYAAMPKPGTIARRQLADRVAELKAQGMTHLAISIKLNISNVSLLIKEWRQTQQEKEGS